jgi:opacity protein-like surface antigen
MPSLSLISLLRRFSFACAMLIVASGFASAQTGAAQDEPGSTTDSTEVSSSNDPRLPQIAELAMPNGLASLPAAPAPSAQSDSRYGGSQHGIVNSLAFEVGGGFSAPVDTHHITWGGNFTLGGGINFNKQFAMLIEYQFMSNKLPGYLIAQTGADGGHAHIWSFTLSPVVSLFPKSKNDVYVTGGGGFYRKVTSFTNPVPALYCSYYYCSIVSVNQVFGHFSSNQGGWNVGAGYQHRMGGMFNDSRMKLFAEARYLKIYTPAYSNQPNGLGRVTLAADTTLIPVTFGVRW